MNLFGWLMTGGVVLAVGGAVAVESSHSGIAIHPAQAKISDLNISTRSDQKESNVQALLNRLWRRVGQINFNVNHAPNSTALSNVENLSGLVNGGLSLMLYRT